MNPYFLILLFTFLLNVEAVTKLTRDSSSSSNGPHDHHDNLMMLARVAAGSTSPSLSPRRSGNGGGGNGSSGSGRHRSPETGLGLGQATVPRGSRSPSFNQHHPHVGVQEATSSSVSKGKRPRSPSPPPARQASIDLFGQRITVGEKNNKKPSRSTSPVQEIMLFGKKIKSEQQTGEPSTKRIRTNSNSPSKSANGNSGGSVRLFGVHLNQPSPQHHEPAVVHALDSDSSGGVTAAH